MTVPSDLSSARNAGAQSRSKRRLRITVAAVFVVVAVAAAALFTLGPPAVRGAIVSEARARGVALDPGSIELGFGEITLRQPRLSLLGVRGLSVSVA